MKVDKDYCMNSFLQYRTIVDHEKSFKEGIEPFLFEDNLERKKVFSSEQLEEELKKNIEKASQNHKIAIALSGGIDSAILAKYMPKGSVAYTFKCVVPEVEVTDETKVAAQYAKECGLEHRIVEIYWEDYEKDLKLLMKHKGAPIHSIEIQIYKAAMKAKEDGFDTLIFGESADVNYGGFNKLLSKDWTIGEFIDRFCYVLPYKVLKSQRIIMEPVIKYSNNGYVDFHEFARNHYFAESMGSYYNAMLCAGMNFVAPFANTMMGEPLDIERVRKGENKYMIREIYERLYPRFEVPEKIPMPRPMNEWLNNWEGPEREEFLPNCAKRLLGDQKWMIYCLEQFLNFIEK